MANDYRRWHALRLCWGMFQRLEILRSNQSWNRLGLTGNRFSRYRPNFRKDVYFDKEPQENDADYCVDAVFVRLNETYSTLIDVPGGPAKTLTANTFSHIALRVNAGSFPPGKRV